MKLLPLSPLLLIMTACGGGSSSPSPVDPPPSGLAQNPIQQASLNDSDARSGFITGQIQVQATAAIDPANQPSHYEADLVDVNGNIINANWFVSSDANLSQLNLSSALAFSTQAYAIKLYGRNTQGRSAKASTIRILDYRGNSLMTGPGGNEDMPWQYDGLERDKIAIYRDAQSGLCYFDNGLVSVIDMNNEKDNWSGSYGLPNVADDETFPPFSFNCNAAPHNEDRAIRFDNGDIWTYSVLNDAMHYANISYRQLFELLAEPPLSEKIRLRVHYSRATLGSSSAYWDGAYANFTEGYTGFNSSATLDIIAHEVAHGVLNRLVPSLGVFGQDYPIDVKTAHEAFADITGFVVKYKHSGQMQWQHGEEAQLRERQLNQIITEAGAVESYLDYDDAGDNQYLAIGLLSYPFSEIVKSRGVEASYKLFVDAAQSCWQADHSLEDMARCIKTTSEQQGQASDDIVSAFKQVKIRLFDQGVLSHFETAVFKLRADFSDDSRSSDSTISWNWDFGDGQSSNQANPSHTYASAGEYNVRLTVEDSSGDSDTISRKISVNDQYCPPQSTSFTLAQINSIVIDGQAPINYNQGQHDYSQTVITLSDKSNVSLQINGNRNTQSTSITWIAWLDANDNGVFEAEEIIKKQNITATDPYVWNTTLDLSAIEDNQMRYIRFAGRSINTDPCSQYLGQLADFKLQ